MDRSRWFMGTLPLGGIDDDARVQLDADGARDWSPVAAVYGALLDPDALVEWLPPAGMTGRMHAFDARVGGGYEMSLY